MMVVAYAIATLFLALTFSLLCLIQFRDLEALIYYGKVAQGRNHPDSGVLARVINAVAKITVPKAWFAHFYVMYLVLMLGQLVVAPHLIWHNGKYLLIWLFLSCQATRRLYESYNVTSWSAASKMHVSHYLLGFVFYVGISTTCFLGLQNQKLFANPERGVFLRVWIGVLSVVFVYFQVDQFNNHRHLASLVKYSTPYKGLFTKVSSAHYLDEIVIYFVVAILAFTRGEIIPEDWALLSMWVFVVTILSISAMATHKFYQEKFDDFSVKYAILPGLL